MGGNTRKKNRGSKCCCRCTLSAPSLGNLNTFTNADWGRRRKVKLACPSSLGIQLCCRNIFVRNSIKVPLHSAGLWPRHHDNQCKYAKSCLLIALQSNLSNYRGAEQQFGANADFLLGWLSTTLPQGIITPLKCYCWIILIFSYGTFYLLLTH